MKRSWSMLFLVGGILVSAQTIGIAAARPTATAQVCDESCEPCPLPCGDSCPLPCASDGAGAMTATSCPLPCSGAGADEASLTTMTIE